MFPSDIARWALGGRDPNEQDNSNNETDEAAAAAPASAPLTDEDMRARRMARLAALEQQQQQQQQQQAPEEPMEVDLKTESSGMEIDTPEPTKTDKKNAISATPTTSSPQPPKKQAKLTPAEKLSLKKNTLLHKVLLLSLHKDTGLNLNLTFDNFEKGEWDQSHIAEILATRLSYAKTDSRLNASSGGNDLIAYLGGCYGRAWAEWKEVGERKRRVTSKNGGGEGEEELESILVEMRSQVRDCFDILVCLT